MGIWGRDRFVAEGPAYSMLINATLVDCMGFVGGELFENQRYLHPRGAGNQSLRHSPGTTALSGMAIVAFILSLGWYLYSAESPAVGGKWALAQQQPSYQTNPDDYVEELMTLVLSRAGAADVSQ